MELFTYSTKQNELIRINPAHIVGLRSFISDDGSSARFEIHTTSPTLNIIQEFNDVDEMKEEFERVERLLMKASPTKKVRPKANVIIARGYDSEQDKPRKIDNWSMKP